MQGFSDCLGGNVEVEDSLLDTALEKEAKP